MDKILPAQYQRAFKDADIRGITVAEIDDDLVYAVARSFVEEFSLTDILVGEDMRISTPSLTEAFTQGVLDAGANVINIGLVHSPMLYFASGSMNLPGVMITASHSPADYNGLKLVQPGAIPLTKETGLNAILKRVRRNRWQAVSKKGKRKAKDIRSAYTKFILNGWDSAGYEPIKIAVDAGNGMGSILEPVLRSELKLHTALLFGDMDGRFPNRGSDPTIRKHQKHLVKVLKAEAFDFGIAFDGDADRIAFLDERGQFINCAAIGALIVERLNHTHPKASYVFTNLTSRVYEETIKKVGGKAIRARVGHAYLKQKMRERNAVFACEHSGHFFFKDFFYTDSVLLTLRYVLEAYVDARRQGMTFSELMKPYQTYVQLEDVVIPVQNKQVALRAIEYFIAKRFKNARVKKFDGLYVDMQDVWGGVKASVTEHAIKIMFEGKNSSRVKEVQSLIVEYVRSIAHKTK